MSLSVIATHNNVYRPGDFIEFKNFTMESDTYVSSVSNGLNQNLFYDNYMQRGMVVDNSDPDLLEINVIDILDHENQDTGKDHNEGNRVWISPISITRHYPADSIQHLSIRLILRERWRNFIFREVKTIKAKDPYLVSYHYVNDSGFTRVKKFNNVTEAQREVPYELSKNINVHFKDYFGFTTDRTIRNNDIHYNQEVFFSKKCYGELNLDGKVITGDYSPRRGFKSIPPRPKQYVCGLVENGEKGLFYRKWFICSKEFLTLWTMICEPDHYSLKKKVDNKYVTKKLDEIMDELDGSHYDVSENSDTNIEEIKKKYTYHNVENLILYIPDVYQRVIKAIFTPSELVDDWIDYGAKIKSDLIWMLE